MADPQPVEIITKQVPENHDLSTWCHVIAVTANGAYWPVAVAHSPGRAAIVQRALQAYADEDPDRIVNEIYEAMGDQ